MHRRRIAEARTVPVRHPIAELMESIGLRLEPPTVQTERHECTHECRALVPVDRCV
jgi:hypothetical protein